MCHLQCLFPLLLSDLLSISDIFYIYFRFPAPSVFRVQLNSFAPFLSVWKSPYRIGDVPCPFPRWKWPLLLHNSVPYSHVPGSFRSLDISNTLNSQSASVTIQMWAAQQSSCPQQWGNAQIICFNAAHWVINVELAFLLWMILPGSFTSFWEGKYLMPRLKSSVSAEIFRLNLLE